MLDEKQWFKAICDSYANPPVYVDGKLLPAFPSDTVQTNTTGQAGPATLKEADVFYQDCAHLFAELGKPLNANSELLDFGVGWGRIARFFLREIPLENIHGLDVMAEFVDICRETFRSPNFHVTTPFPPTQMQSEKFNFVVGYSVFSHLSEEACKQWMAEFYRITKPGAIVALTTRGRPFFDYCESLKGKGYGGYSDALANMFENFDDARKRYDSGEIVHSNSYGVTGGGAMTADFYGETFIPEQYAQHAYSEHFSLERFLYDPSRQSHPIMFFRRK
jgi:hypothetical protein